MRINVNATPGKEWGESSTILADNLYNIDAILCQFKGSRAYASLLAFCRSVNHLSRAKFLRGLQRFLEENLRCDADVVCSAGAGITDSRQTKILGAGCAVCDPDEHLIINLYGASAKGNFIPLVVFNRDDVELEGIINVVSSPGVHEDRLREELLGAVPQMIALIFRNLKLAGRLAEICPKAEREHLDNLLNSYHGDTEGLMNKLRAIGNSAMRTKSGHAPARPGFKVRLLRFLKRKTAILLMLMTLLFSTVFASYAEIRPLNEPFNCAVACVGKVTLDIPFSATKKALDDGLLRTMVDTRDPQQVHDWLKGGNPSEIDYEEVLMENGWDNRHLHRVGRVLGMVP